MSGVVYRLFALASRIWRRPGVTEANTGRIRVWMTEKRVESILGCPAMVHFPSPSSARFTSKSSIWTGKKGGVVIDFVGNDSVGWRVSDARFRRGLRLTKTAAPERPPTARWPGFCRPKNKGKVVERDDLPVFNQKLPSMPRTFPPLPAELPPGGPPLPAPPRQGDSNYGVG